MDDDHVFFEPPEAGNDVEDAAITVLESIPAHIVTDPGRAAVYVENSQGMHIKKEDGNDGDGDYFTRPSPSIRIEVLIPEISHAKRNEYLSIHSEIIEFVVGEISAKRGQSDYKVEFSDGREQQVRSRNTVDHIIDSKRSWACRWKIV